MSIVMKMIVKADAETRYSNSNEMEQIKSFIINGERRLRIVVMKQIVTSVLSGEDASEVSFYFDYPIGALS